MDERKDPESSAAVTADSISDLGSAAYMGIAISHHS
jgi:hypothetical protein